MSAHPWGWVVVVVASRGVLNHQTSFRARFHGWEVSKYVEYNLKYKHMFGGWTVVPIPLPSSFPPVAFLVRALRGW